MREFDEFVKQVGKSARLDPWVRERGFAGYVQELKKEADEVIEAIGNNDRENIREELGDVLYDWLHACALAGIPLRDIIASAAEKLVKGTSHADAGDSSKPLREKEFTGPF